MRKEEEEQFIRETKQAADAARVADENASSEGRHTSGGVFVATNCDLGVVIDKEEGAVKSILGNE